LFIRTDGKISNFQEYYKVVEYFSNTQSKNGISYGVNNLVDIFDEKILSPFKWKPAFGKLFFRTGVLYPNVITPENLKYILE
jgi:hypothetical protein